MGQKSVYFILGSHLDLFWMGTYGECLERGAEIIKEALELCKKYKEYCFFIETVAFADYFLRKYPNYKELLLRLIKEDRIEIGGVYVDRIEHTHGGESLIRQAIYGVKWLKDSLGVVPKSVMHPDLPGLSPQIPQIYSKTGIKYYLQARGPFFYGAICKWQAPDGSNIVYCNLPFHYGTKDEATIERCLDHSHGFSLNRIIVRGGYSDLEMPNAEIIEQIKILRKKHKNTIFNISSPSNVLSSYASIDLPVIKGEIPYGWGSAATRKIDLFQMSVELENGLLTCEKFSTIGKLMGLKVFPIERKKSEGADYWSTLDEDIYGPQTYLTLNATTRPQYIPNKRIYGDKIEKGKELEETWRYELFTQDHNYGGWHGAQSEFDKREMKKYALCYANDILDSLLTGISARIKTENKGIPIIVYNSMSWERNGIAKVDISLLGKLGKIKIKDDEEKTILHQVTENGLCFLTNGLPSIGYKTYYLEKPDDNQPEVSHSIISATTKNKKSIENDSFLLKIDLDRGIIESIYDKKLGKELVDKNNNEMSFGELISYEDPGVDVRHNFTGKRTRDSNTHFKLKNEEKGNVFTKIVLETLFLDAKFEKEIIVYNTINRIDFKVRTFWWGKKNEHIRLCLPFVPIDFQQTYYGVPFYVMKWPEMMQGVEDENILERGTEIRDEMLPEDRKHSRLAIKWLDIDYKDYGITIATKTPSFWIDNQIVQAVLLRTQYSCGDHRLWQLAAGKHEWEFPLLIHQGDWKKGKAYRQGWNFNNPLMAKIIKVGEGKGSLPQKKSFCSIWPENLLITAMKKAYEGDFTIIRCLEAEGKEVEAKINFFKPIKEAFDVNLLEEGERRLACEGNSVKFKIRGYEIKTLRIKI